VFPHDARHRLRKRRRAGSRRDPIVLPRASSRALNIPRIGILCAAFKILNVNDNGGAGCAGISAIFHWRF